jgi:hypothetical protein
MNFNSVEDIERAIAELTPKQQAELYDWLDRHRSSDTGRANIGIFEQGLGLFGSPADSALLDEVVQRAYEERRRPGEPDSVL